MGPTFLWYCLIFWETRLILCRPFPPFPILISFRLPPVDSRHARRPLRGHARPRGGRPVRAGGRGLGQPRRRPGAGPRVAVPPGRPAGRGGRALPRGPRHDTPRSAPTLAACAGRSRPGAAPRRGELRFLGFHKLSFSCPLLCDMFHRCLGLFVALFNVCVDV